MRKLLASGVALTCAVLVAGCGSGSSGGGSGGSGGSGKTLTIFAASSLTESFQKLEKTFEQQNPGVDVKFNFGGSSSLVQQINEAGGADVFASANEKNMTKLVKAGNNAGEPALFVTNTLEIAVPPGNPKKITGFKDLSKAGTTLVVCASEVPCGSATKKLEKATGVTLKPKSEEQNVKSVLGKVEANEADAGLVYVTDVTSANGKVKGIEFPEADKAVNKYPIVATKDAKQPDLAKKWIALVRGPQGQAVLKKAGFEIP
jgi:molybdate transport system substrate-binding protein